MNRMGGISQILQDIRRALTGLLLQHRLVRVLARPEIAQAHSRDRLKLCVCGPRSNHRNPVPSGGILFHQLMKRGNRIFGQIQIRHGGGIKERFQLKENDVRHHRIVLLRFSLAFLNLIHKLLGIPVGLADPRLKQRYRQTVRITVILIGKRDIYKIAGKHPSFQRQIRDAGKQKHADDNRRNVHIPADFSPVLRPLKPEPYQEQKHHGNGRKSQNHRAPGHIFRHHRRAVAEILQIRPGKRRDPVGQDHAVDHTEQKPEKRHNQTYQHSSPKQVNNQKCRKYQKCIVQKDQRLLRHNRPGLYGRSAGKHFNDKVQKAASHRLKRQRQKITDFQRLRAGGTQLLSHLFRLLPPKSAGAFLYDFL